MSKTSIVGSHGRLIRFLEKIIAQSERLQSTGKPRSPEAEALYQEAVQLVEKERGAKL